MGIDAGFDVVPRLTNGAVDQQNWSRFLDSVKQLYKDDDRVELKPNYILFRAGEHPMLPFECHKILRFSSKVSGRIASETGVADYIERITWLAKLHFGSRIRAWHESDESGFYTWTDVRASIDSYEQPDEQEMPTSIAGFVSGTDPLNELNAPLFEIDTTPGKGRRLVARFNIRRGSRILVEKPLVTFPCVRLRPKLLEVILASKLNALSKTQQRQILSLHNNSPGRYPFSGIAMTNCLPCGSGSLIGGLYPTICLINHSCLPNAHNNWNSEQEHETIHAIRPILAGEEITISYTTEGPSAVRHSHLRRAFGFDCTCDVCTLPSSELHVSDTRRIRIQRLDEAIGNPLRMQSSPAASLRDCKIMLKTLEEEYGVGGAPPLMRLYYDAFQIAIAHGDKARAAVFAKCAHEYRVVCEGEDSPEAKRIKIIRDNPSLHGSFGLCSMAWKTKRQSTPKGATPGEFESWLWGRASSA